MNAITIGRALATNIGTCLQSLAEAEQISMLATVELTEAVVNDDIETEQTCRQILRRAVIKAEQLQAEYSSLLRDREQLTLELLELQADIIDERI